MTLVPWLIFTLLIGACVGSFLNVVIYRLPAGQSVVHPPSSCPRCGHRLAWYDNVPVLGWFWLRGKCRYCANPIAFQYPLIEAMTALICAGWFAVCYMTDLRPDFAGPGIGATWPIFAVNIALLAGLIAATVVDGRYFIIPLGIPWTLAAVGCIALPIIVSATPAAVGIVNLPPVTERGVPLLTQERMERIDPPAYQRVATVEAAIAGRETGMQRLCAAPLAGPGLAAAALGGTLGWVIALVLLKLRILPLSFADDPAAHDEPEQLAEHEEGIRQLPLLLGPIIGAAGGALWLDRHWNGSWARLSPVTTIGLCALAGYVSAAAIMVGLTLLTRREPETQAPADEEDGVVFEPHPHARREIMKEILFVSLPLAGALGAWCILRGPGWDEWLAGSPAVTSLTGSLAGLLLGAGTVWGVRIAGTLGFGKEAMGLGDVHLMMAVGAVCGWPVAVLAFFVAPFIGLVHTFAAVGLGSMLRFRGRQIPYGPHLAAATLIVMIAREPLLSYFGMLMSGNPG
ncbi:MAG: hypothetical protein GC162_03870 [Planctomycetes bacterium]|nr:hypothetical protein [Planctomycetota bacterium]